MINQHSIPAITPVTTELRSAMDLENAYISRDPNVLRCEYLSQGKPAFDNVRIFVRGLEPQRAQDFGATLLSGLTGIAEPDYRGTMGEALVDIVNFGLVYGISADYPHRLEVFVRLTSPQCHQKHTIEREILAVLAEADDRLAKSLGGEGFKAFKVNFDHPLVPKWTQECISHNFRTVTDKEKIFKALCVASGVLQKGQLPDELYEFGVALRPQLVQKHGEGALEQTKARCLAELERRKNSLPIIH